MSEKMTMDKDEIFHIITRHVGEVIPALKDRQFQSGDVLKDLGANSIDRSEIVMMTLESLSLKIPLIETNGAANLGELASMLYEKLQSR
jgi:polyketide biosynthesis acyl carrier protein